MTPGDSLGLIERYWIARCRDCKGEWDGLPASGVRQCGYCTSRNPGERVTVAPVATLEGAVGDRDELAALLTEAVRSDYGTPGWRARAIKAGCLTTSGGQS